MLKSGGRWLDLLKSIASNKYFQFLAQYLEMMLRTQPSQGTGIQSGHQLSSAGTNPPCNQLLHQDEPLKSITMDWEEIKRWGVRLAHYLCPPQLLTKGTHLGISHWTNPVWPAWAPQTPGQTYYQNLWGRSTWLNNRETGKDNQTGKETTTPRLSALLPSRQHVVSAEVLILSWKVMGKKSNFYLQHAKKQGLSLGTGSDVLLTSKARGRNRTNVIVCGKSNSWPL